MNQIEKAKIETAKKCNCKICKKTREGIKDIKEERSTTYKSIDDWEHERTIWKNIHPIRYEIQQTYYSIIRFYSRIGDFFLYDIKAFIQRGSRGYANRDVWGFHRYLSEVISGGIDRLIKELHGHPCNLKTLNEWKIILEKIKKTFKTAESIDNGTLQYLSKKLFNDTERKKYIKITKELNKEHSYYNKRTMTKKENREYEKGWELFQEYFFNLWD